MILNHTPVNLSKEIDKTSQTTCKKYCLAEGSMQATSLNCKPLQASLTSISVQKRLTTYMTNKKVETRNHYKNSENFENRKE